MGYERVGQQASSYSSARLPALDSQRTRIESGNGILAAVNGTGTCRRVVAADDAPACPSQRAADRRVPEHSAQVAGPRADVQEP